jgi:hypothetical protein
MSRTIVFICLLLLPLFAHGEEGDSNAVPGFPGWSLEKIAPEEEGEVEGGIAYSRATFFSLKPPDKRPAASINERMASRLRSGEIGPEAAYTGSNGEEKPVAGAENGASAVSGAGALIWNGKGFSTAPGSNSGPSGMAAAPMGNAASMTGSSSAPAASQAAPAMPSSGASSSGASSSPAVGTDSATRNVASIVINNEKKGTAISMGSVVAAAACAALSAPVDNCTISTAANAGANQNGTCAAGFVGSCNYSCSNGVWTKVSNSCSSAAGQLRGCDHPEYGSKYCCRGGVIGGQNALPCLGN